MGAPVIYGRYIDDVTFTQVIFQETSLNTDFLVANARLTLQPAQAGNDDFIYRLYASTRADEMAMVDWTDEQKEAFLRMQLNAQTEHYAIHFPNAQYHILQREGVAIGRLITNRSQDQLLLMDIALLPEYRNAGVGTTIMQDLMNEADEAGVPLVLRVEFFNPVIRLYTRLGFVKTREVNAVYHEMIWTPASKPVVE